MNNKRKLKERSVNPFTLASKCLKEDCEILQSYWTCVICTRRIRNDPFQINNHIDNCLLVSSKTTKKDQYECIDLNIFPEAMELVNLFHVIKGLWIIHNFLSVSEEESLIKDIDEDSSTPWKLSSFNGCTDTKVFGVITQFGLPQEERLVRKNDPSKNELGIPTYLQSVVHKLSQLSKRFPELCRSLHLFRINECNINSYIKERGHYLLPHYDDRALSGPLLLNISMGCPAIMTYSCDGIPAIPINLPRRCLQIVSEDARYRYKHSIKSEDIQGDRRVSLTLREAGGKKGVVNNTISKLFGA
jgi:hypothetical protein